MPHQPTSPSATSLMDHSVKRLLNATPLFTPAAAIFLRISMAHVENFPLKSFCSVISELCGPIWGQRHLRRQAPASDATDTIRSSFTSFVQALVAEMMSASATSYAALSCWSMKGVSQGILKDLPWNPYNIFGLHVTRSSLLVLAPWASHSGIPCLIFRSSNTLPIWLLSFAYRVSGSIVALL
jgi:hypothetical protein